MSPSLPPAGPASRELLLQDLERYEQTWHEDDARTLARYRDFVESTPDCCLRTHLAGHCTGSALIACPRGQRVLLLYHPFLQRWLQPGGHADGDPDLLSVAIREATEETGLRTEELITYGWQAGERVPLDLDIHTIPARPHKNEPAHFHYDLRYLLIASPDHPLTPETPELQLAWLTLTEVLERTDEESVLRMLRKLERLPRDAGGRLLHLRANQQPLS